MTCSKMLYVILTGHAPLVSLVAQRITPDPLPQNQILPACTYSFVGGPVANAFGTDPNIFQPRVQLNGWAKSFLEAEAVIKAARASLRNRQGTFTDTQSVIVLQGSYIEMEPFHLYEFATGIHHLTLDATLHYSETAV